MVQEPVAVAVASVLGMIESNPDGWRFEARPGRCDHADIWPKVGKVTLAH
jgi:hypothetical protein